MVGEGLVRRCFTEEAARLLGAVAPQSSRVLGVDEFSIKKGHVYDTAIMDIEHKQVLGVVSGRGQKSVEAFLDRLPDREAIEAVVMDMHEPFRQAVELCLPGAKVVADKFHVATHVNQALDQVRIGLQAKGDKKKELFRRRYLLLKGAERLTEENKERLERLFFNYPELAVAWALKERFRRWYRLDTREEAEAELAQWEESVRQHGLHPFTSSFPCCGTGVRRS